MSQDFKRDQQQNVAEKIHGQDKVEILDMKDTVPRPSRHLFDENDRSYVAAYFYISSKSF